MVFCLPCMCILLILCSRGAHRHQHATHAGLTIYSVVPTTLGVGVALVRSCKGNEAIALLLTVASNMLGIVTVPLMLKMLLHNRSDVSVVINLLDLFIKLAITIVAPSVVGKVRSSGALIQHHGSLASYMHLWLLPGAVLSAAA